MNSHSVRGKSDDALSDKPIERIDHMVRFRRKYEELTTASLILGMLTGLSACVQVTARTSRLSINLKLNIKQEVVYRLDGEQKNPDQRRSAIFF